MCTSPSFTWICLIFSLGFNRNCCYTSCREVCGLETSCRSRPKSNIVKDIYFLWNTLVDGIKMDKKHFRWTKGFKSGLWSAENSNFDHLIRIWVNSDNLSQLRRWGLCNISLEPPKHCEERPLFKLFTLSQLKKCTSALQQLFKAQQRSFEEKVTDLHHNVYSELFNYFLKIWNNYFSVRTAQP